MDIAVQFVNWNNSKLIHKHVILLNELEPSVKVLVIDNSKNYNPVASELILSSNKNLGYAGGNNISLDILHKFEYLVIVNPDVYDVHWFEVLQEIKLTYPDILSVRGNNPLFSGLYWNFVRIYWRRRIPSIYGSFFAIKTGIFISEGGFNSDYFMYHEEHELAIRLFKSGYSVNQIDNYYKRPQDRNMLVQWKWKFKVLNSLKTICLHYPKAVQMVLISVRYIYEHIHIRRNNLNNDRWLKKICCIALRHI